MTTTPTTWLPPIPGLTRDPEHRYHLGEITFPISVTGVLSCLKSAYAMERIEATRSSWEARGNTAHRALELFLGLFFSPAGGWNTESALELLRLKEGEFADWVVPLIGHDRWHHLQVIASERPTCCVKRRVAGTYDTAYIDEAGRRVIADLKSLGENGATYCTRAQLGGYMALEATHGVSYSHGQTIWCRPGSTTFSPLYSRAECLLAWAGAWACWRARNPDHGIS